MAEQVNEWGGVANRFVHLRHAAHVQRFTAVDDQQGKRTVAAQLDRQPAGLFEVVGQQQRRGGHLAQQFDDARGVVAPGQQLFPDGIQMDDSAANVEIFEKETLYTVGHYFNSLS